MASSLFPTPKQIPLSIKGEGELATLFSSVFVPKTRVRGGHSKSKCPPLERGGAVVKTMLSMYHTVLSTKRKKRGRQEKKIRKNEKRRLHVRAKPTPKPLKKNGKRPFACQPQRRPKTKGKKAKTRVFALVEGLLFHRIDRKLAVPSTRTPSNESLYYHLVHHHKHSKREPQLEGNIHARQVNLD